MTDHVLSADAIVFGAAYLPTAYCSLSFGGEEAEYQITPRARAALDELIAAGFAVQIDGNDAIAGREHYRGADHGLGKIAQASGIDFFGEQARWTTFVKRAKP
jgi:hypothetical protein